MSAAASDEPYMSPSSNPTPLLMLDIDGVMNTTSSALRLKTGEVFAPEPVMALRWLVARTKARVVVTSSRRRAGLAVMRDLFVRNQLDGVAERIIDLTPILTDSDTDDWREEEIATWLETQPFMLRRLVILDDKPFTGPLARRLVRTNSDHGLTWELARFAATKIAP
jgi:hypothetical protein